MSVLLFDLLEITEQWKKRFNNRKIKISKCMIELKRKNPCLYKNINKNIIKNALIKLFPVYKNNKKNTKYFKISKKMILEFREKNYIRDYEKINKDLYGFYEETY